MERKRKQAGSRFMKRFICYLYEYQEGRRIRNIGFCKVESSEDGCTVSIHGKGWGMNSPRKLSLYLFWRENGKCFGVYQGELGNVSPALNYRLSYTEEDVGSKARYDRVEGIILCGENGPRYAAVWTDEAVDISRMEPAEPVQQKTIISKNPILAGQPPDVPRLHLETFHVVLIGKRRDLGIDPAHFFPELGRLSCLFLIFLILQLGGMQNFSFLPMFGRYAFFLCIRRMRFFRLHALDDFGGERAFCFFGRFFLFSLTVRRILISNGIFRQRLFRGLFRFSVCADAIFF